MIERIELAIGYSTVAKVFPSVNDGLICDELYGLGPVPVQLNLAKIGLTAGRTINSITMPERNIVMHWTSIGAGSLVTEAKEMLTKVFTPGTHITVRVKDSMYNRDLKADGIVESVSPDFVGPSAKNGLQMSIICPKPIFEENGVYAYHSARMVTRSGPRTDGLQALIPAAGDDVPMKAAIYLPFDKAYISDLSISSGYGSGGSLTLKNIGTLVQGRYHPMTVVFDGSTHKVTARVGPSPDPEWIDITDYLSPSASDWSILTKQGKAATLFCSAWHDYGAPLPDDGQYWMEVSYGPAHISQNGV